MPLNGSGTYSAPASSWNPSVDDTDIDSTDWAALLSDISTVLSTAIYKDGQQAASATVPFAYGIDLSASTGGQVKFPSTQNASSNANTLDDYEEYTSASTACSGAITASVAWKLVKVGNSITLVIPAVTGTASGSNASFTVGLTLPSRFRPSANLAIPVVVYSGSAVIDTPGSFSVVAATGVMSISLTASGGSNFTSNAGVNSAVTVCWTL